MRIFDETKTVELTEFDLAKGYLKTEFIETEIAEQAAVAEVSHYEVVKQYENGGYDVKKVIDVEEMPYAPARVEREEIGVYIPYTERELEVMAAEREIRDLKVRLAESDYKAIKYAEGFITEPEYAPIRAERQAWRERIGALEAVLVDGGGEGR
ncbi:MAG: hypothetical protein IJC64_04405 [Clostridia bacterium]|nr:hypothetical protein [Clostridia bacterium]